MNEIVSIISNVGFPIAMCITILYYWNNQYTKTINGLKETISRLTEVVSSNTTAIKLLLSKIGDDE